MGRRSLTAVLLTAILNVLVWLHGEPTAAGMLNLGLGEGLPSNDIGVITDDSDGAAWIESGSALVRFDGARVAVFNSTNSPLPPSVSINALIDDHLGLLWVGTSSGLFAFDRGRSLWLAFPPGPNGPASQVIHGIVEDHAHELWFTTSAGISRLSASRTIWSVFNHQSVPQIPIGDILGVAEDRFHRLWFGTNSGGALVLDSTRTQWAALPIVSVSGGNTVRDIAIDAQDRIWFLIEGSQQFAVFDPRNPAHWVDMDDILPAIFGVRLNSMSAGPDGEVWMARPRFFDTEGSDPGGVMRFGGLDLISGGDVRLDGLVSDDVKTLHWDRSGALWIGTSSGVSRFDEISAPRFQRHVDPFLLDVRDLVVARDGRVWAAAIEPQARVFDGNAWSFQGPGVCDFGPRAVLEDAHGDFWLASGDFCPLRRFPSRGCNSWGPTDVISLHQDHRGRIWMGGISSTVRFDTTRACGDVVTVPELSGKTVRDIQQDRAFDFWFATDQGLFRVDSTLTRWSSRLVDDRFDKASALFEDRDRNLWVGTDGFGVAVLNRTRSSWIAHYDVSDGLAGSHIREIVQDNAGHMWAASDGGLSRFDGLTWASYTAADGMVGNDVRALVFVPSGVPAIHSSDPVLWIGTDAGVTRLTPERFAPQSLILTAPKSTSGVRSHTVSFRQAFVEEAGVQFSVALDGVPLTPLWSSERFREFGPLPDRDDYELTVIARDRIGNIETSPARVRFSVDATAPAPAIQLPRFGDATRDSVVITGSVADLRFGSYSVSVRPLSGTCPSGLDTVLVAGSTEPIVDDVLAVWRGTRSCPDGDYVVTLSVRDTLGLVGTAAVRVAVDNVFPFAAETSPALVTSVAGGHVYTTDASVHMYFPPGAFPVDTLVRIDPVPPFAFPATIRGGSATILAGFDIGWGNVRMDAEKRATLAIRTDLGSSGATGGRAIYRLSGASETLLGGTVAGDTITTAIRDPGRYVLVADGAPAPRGGPLETLTLTPRVFAPLGGFSNAEVAIGFSVSAATTATVEVYDRTGRLVRRVSEAMPVTPGINVVKWNGRDGDGAVVAADVYLVSVRAGGSKSVKPLAVVR